MTWPLEGSEGWEELRTIEPVGPVSRPLPIIYRAFYFDPAALNGIGNLQPSVWRTVGASSGLVRGNLEARFSQPEVYGVALLDSVAPPVGGPCTLTLTVYADDGTTELWVVGTDPRHIRPYLVNPDNYESQELDAATCAVTLGTVRVTVIDRPTVPGDQDSGWLTSLLSLFGIPNLAGHRCRLLRFIDETNGYVVVADGPAGPVSLDSSYAAYSWDIRDTREIERKVRCFVDGGNQGLLPEGILDGYGFDAGSSTYLLAPVGPLYGVFNFGDVVFPGPGVWIGSVALTGFPNQAYTRIISEAAYHAINEGLSHPMAEAFRSNPAFLFRWRAKDSSDPWKEISATLQMTLDIGVQAPNDYFDNALEYDIQGFVIADPRLNPLLPQYDPAAPDLPTDTEDIEFYLTGPLLASEGHPVLITGLSAGAFVKNVYDGVYSPRDPETGDLVPTGIRYDADAVLLMTEAVRLRITEPWADARDKLEKLIYQPTGWIPALDRDGLISPVSQVAPQYTPTGTVAAGWGLRWGDNWGGGSDAVALLAVIQNANTEAAPSWSSGQRIINVLRFTYYREYASGPVDGPVVGTDERQHRLISPPQTVLIEFRDDISVRRHGEQVLEIDGSAFSAIGKDDPSAAPPTFPVPVVTGGSWVQRVRRALAAAAPLIVETATPARAIIPVSGDAADEAGHRLAYLREANVLNRYALGAPTMEVNVMRRTVPLLRAGDWVVLSLSWFPDYVIGRRSLLALAQVVSLGDLDCAWRRLLVEQVVPLPPTS